MDDRPRAFPPDATETRRWIGRLLVAVLVGEGIWNVIVSLMNNVVVPWLGDVMGQSSGLPTSFTQRPYDYPDLFVAIIELCLAGLVAIAINSFFQKPRRGRTKVQKRVASPTSVAPARLVPVATTPAPVPAVVPRTEVQAPVAPPRVGPTTAPVSPPVATTAPPSPVRAVPVVEAQPSPLVQPLPPLKPFSPPTPVVEAQSDPLVHPLPPLPPPKPVSPPAPVPTAVKPAPPAPPPPPAKARPKKVYYNSVGEPIEFDDD
jgi:hypothetical protein